MSDHAPLGDVAFRTEPRDLFHSAQSIFEQAVHLPDDLYAALMADAAWFEGFALTMGEIRRLPCSG